jgi:hypothetical protein
MARVKTRFVVRRGSIGVPVGEVRANLRGTGAKRESVPVPVLFQQVSRDRLGGKMHTKGRTGLDEILLHA